MESPNKYFVYWISVLASAILHHNIMRLFLVHVSDVRIGLMHVRRGIFFYQVCVRFNPTSADSVTLFAFAPERLAAAAPGSRRDRSVSPAPGPQQQTRHSGQ